MVGLRTRMCWFDSLFLKTDDPPDRIDSARDPSLADLLLASAGIFDTGVDRLCYRPVLTFHLGAGTRHTHVLRSETLCLCSEVLATCGNGIAHLQLRNRSP